MQVAESLAQSARAGEVQGVENDELERRHSFLAKEKGALEQKISAADKILQKEKATGMEQKGTILQTKGEIEKLTEEIEKKEF